MVPLKSDEDEESPDEDEDLRASLRKCHSAQPELANTAKKIATASGRSIRAISIAPSYRIYDKPIRIEWESGRSRAITPQRFDLRIVAGVSVVKGNVLQVPQRWLLAGRGQEALSKHSITIYCPVE